MTVEQLAEWFMIDGGSSGGISSKVTTFNQDLTQKG
jgi:hypothetical protein